MTQPMDAHTWKVLLCGGFYVHNKEGRPMSKWNVFFIFFLIPKIPPFKFPISKRLGVFFDPMSNVLVPSNAPLFDLYYLEFLKWGFSPTFEIFSNKLKNTDLEYFFLCCFKSLLFFVVCCGRVFLCWDAILVVFSCDFDSFFMRFWNACIGVFIWILR